MEDDRARVAELLEAAAALEANEVLNPHRYATPALHYDRADPELNSPKCNAVILVTSQCW
jgi:hypothetical protein